MQEYIGKKYGRLTVLADAGRDKHNHPKWLFKCDCGVEKAIKKTNVLSGLTVSCGCFFIETMKKTFTKHGESIGRVASPEYTAWHRMKQRCYKEDHQDYPEWGGRGIRVCDRWLESFENFLADMGRRTSPKHSLDRFPNNDGNYELTNCRWATKKEQAANRRSTKWYEHNGERKMLKEWAELFRVASSDVNYFLKKKGKNFEFVYNYYMNKT